MLRVSDVNVGVALKIKQGFILIFALKHLLGQGMS